MENGVHPEHDHCNKKFGTCIWGEMAGTPLPLKSFILECRGDWGGLPGTFATPQWNNARTHAFNVTAAYTTCAACCKTPTGDACHGN
eukprot:2606139-Amphidinium_carterae.1